MGPAKRVSLGVGGGTCRVSSLSLNRAGALGGGRDPETFLRAFRRLDSFRGDSQFGTWLYRVALNTAYSHQKRRARSPVEYHGCLYEFDTTGTSPDARMLRAELDGQVRAALSELSPKLRAAIVLTSLRIRRRKRPG